MADFQNQTASLKPEQIIEIVIRRRWFIIIPLCIFLTIGFYTTITSNPIYQASTTILIQPQKVPSDYVQSIVTSGLAQRINTISQRIMSRTNLKKIIDKFGLYQNQEGMLQEDKINSMRGRVIVEQNSNRRQGTATFTVSFTGNDPEIVKNIANELAGFFMDENLKARESQAIGTSEFLESELGKIQRKLEDREKVLAIYRSKYLGGLPDELEANLRTLDRLQSQHTDASNALRDTQNAKSLLKSRILKLKEIDQNNINSLDTIVGSSVMSITQQQYVLEKRRLDALFLKYTAKHPEVIKLTKSVEKLKNKIEEEKKTNDQNSEPTGEMNAANASNNVLFQHEYNLKQLEHEIAKIQENMVKISKTTTIYQKRVENTPKRELELQTIQRDYNNIRANYNSLLARRLEAEISVNMEKKQKGEQFHILDYAIVPQRPISPDIKKLFAFSLVLGLGVGGGIIFLLEFFNPAIRSENQIEAELDLPILVSIPSLDTPGDNLKKWIERSAFFIVALYACIMIFAFTLLYLNGIKTTLSFIKTYINI